MKYLLSTLITTIAVGMFATPVKADTIIDTFGGSNNTASGWTATAQTITAPADNVLKSYRWNLAARSVPGDVRFAVYEWAGNGPNGAPLYETTLPWSAEGDYEKTAIDLSLVEGVLYGMVIDLLGYEGFNVRYTQNSYPGGNGLFTFDLNGDWTNFASLDHQFRAEFGPEVIYTCIDPFDPPFDAPLTLKTKKNGAIPVKMQLYDVDGFLVTEADFDAPPVVNVNFAPSSGDPSEYVTDDLLQLARPMTITSSAMISMKISSFTTCPQNPTRHPETIP